LMTVRLALFGAFDSVQADAFRVLVVENFEGIAVEDPDDEAMILRDSGGWSGCQDSEEHTEGPNREATEGGKDDGDGSLAGRRIVGANQHTWQGTMRGLPFGFMPRVLRSCSASVAFTWRTRCSICRASAFPRRLSRKCTTRVTVTERRLVTQRFRTRTLTITLNVNSLTPSAVAASVTLASA